MNRKSKRQVNSPSLSSSLPDKVFLSVDESYGPTASSSTSSDRFAAHHSIPETKIKETVPNRRDADKPERHRSNDFGLNPSHYPNHKIGVMNLKPIRTSTERSNYHHPDRDSSRKMNREDYQNDSSKPKHETASASPSIILQNAKIRAQTMYGDLKDVKQPISPGARLTRFITSLFTKINLSYKGEKVRETKAVRSRHVPATTCSSSTSYHRSCLSSKAIGASKNSGRFCPVNIIIDDERRDNLRLVPSRQKCEVDRIKQRQTESNLRELMNKYKRNEVLSIYDGKLSDEDRHDDDDEEGSCTSSDLFELDHIGGTVNQSINQ